MEIDNFQVHMEHMDFVGPNDRYLVHILRRKRDCGELYNTLGANESQRKIKTYCIESKEYLERKIPAIKELCQCCNARAYLVVQPKDNFQCLLNLGKKILDTIQLQNYSVKPERLLWTAYGEVHTSRKKLWVLDLDNDNMVERWVEVLFGGKALRAHVWTVEEVESSIKKWLKSCGKDPSEMYRVPTRNGWHIITPPFNLQEAQKDCRMLFENQQEMPVRMERKVLQPGDAGYVGALGLDVRYLIETEKKHGWLHKDALSLLFAPATNAKEKINGHP